MHRVLILAFFLGFVVVSGCECNPDEIAKPKPEELADPTHVVPTSARAMLEFERLDLALELGQTLAERFDEGSILASSSRRFADHIFDPWDSAEWRAMGLSTQSPARLFEDGGHWVLHTAMAEPARVETWAAAMDARAGLSITKTEAGSYGIYRLAGESDAALMYLAASETYAFLIPVGRTQPRWPGQSEPLPLTSEEVSTRVKRWTTLSRKERWAEQAWAERFEKAFGKKPLRGAVRPSTWLDTAEQRGDAGQAAVIFERMRRQLGPVGFGLELDVAKAALRGSILTTQMPNEPTFVQELAGARGEIPRVGGLVTPGVLGVVRVSGAPEKFWALFRSLLPAESRIELDATIEEYDAELAIDLMADVLSNINGHALIVIYGFEPQVFRKDNPALISDIFRLRATREAVLVPIESRERMEDVLNVMTQLSRGKLNRQATDRTIQYAWIEEETGLQWAILLADDHLVLVDSTPAFDHAVEYERSARPIGDVMRKRGLAPLLKGKDRSGIYLDSQSLSNLLTETGNTGIASWIRPFSSIVVTAEGEKVDVELRLDE